MIKGFLKAIEEGVASLNFDPEGGGYDYATAKAHGLTKDKDGHWPSRSPKTGQILKGRKHKTWKETEKGEADENYVIFKDPKRGGKYFSKKRE